MSRFDGQVVLITGAGRGIGAELARAFAAEGAQVAANDISPVGLEAVVSELRAAGQAARPFVGDIAQRMVVRSLVEEIQAAYGRLDVLVNNAGVEPHAPLLQLDEWDWDRTLAVNLKGPFLLLQSVGAWMAEHAGGSVVNIASIAGRAHGLKDRAAYVASKTGLIGLTREAARELAAYNIRVNAVCPGVIETEMTRAARSDPQLLARWLEEIPLRRLGQPQDVTGLVLFLCSPQAAYITGQAFHVDGGKVMV